MSDQYLVKDGHCLAVFNSTHRALKAEELLKSRLQNILLIPAPRVLQTDCGLALRFDHTLLNAVINILASHDLLPAYISCMEQGQYTTCKEYSDDNH